MRKANRIITIVLGIAAVAAWFFSSGAVPGLAPHGWQFVRTPLCVTLSAAACFGWLLLFLGERRGDHETRCRKCGYILRGITEPRCPECGERI